MASLPSSEAENIQSSTSNLAKSGCQTTCGNLTVAYPFGIGVGSGCSIDESFDLTCNSTYNPPRLFVKSGEIQINKISDFEMWVTNFLGYRCYNQSGDIDECDEKRNISCYGHCINTAGSYSCTCWPGYTGNAEKADGCQPVAKGSKFPVMIFTLATARQETRPTSCKPQELWLLSIYLVRHFEPWSRSCSGSSQDLKQGCLVGGFDKNST
ncbi:EGF-like calcium-binding domain-containing protein [Artemisia annua]|uniref:EGF-like calcium-binding domain-containing protein n=1 Tax=Artemisia annua TaxID=35608 RepID=A0A2U1NXT5_ARTAN|nr:EGF-like calcium-binding domain-containing protein [Artemisia annua]